MRTEEDAVKVRELANAAACLADHAREKYPHFESSRGQRDINRLEAALDACADWFNQPGKPTAAEAEPVATIDLTPTREGLERSAAIFKAEIEKSERLIAEANSGLEAGIPAMSIAWTRLVTTALEALIEREEARIGHMREGLEACGVKLSSDDYATPEELEGIPLS